MRATVFTPMLAIGILLAGSAYADAYAYGSVATPPSPSVSRSASRSAPLELAAHRILGADQGVYIETADGRVLLAQHAGRPVHPASVSKVPTTLALLRALGPDYHFQTTFVAEGPVVDGQLQGNLTVQSDADPALVDEDALLVAQRLNLLGIRSVSGRLIVQGTLTFDWKEDSQGAQLERALSGAAPPAAWRAVLATHPQPAADMSIAPPALQFLSTADAVEQSASHTAPGDTARRRVLILRSEPLLPMLKALDDYSNNIVAPLAQMAGGAAAVQDVARGAVPARMRTEITLGDGAGTDPRNRLSPRAAVELLRALEAQLATTGHTLPDVLPVAGVDTGTLHDRLTGPEEGGRVVGKTGTYADYGASALIGAIRTRDEGRVYFAILDHGIPVPEARRRQDAFVRVLLAHLPSLPWPHVADTVPAIARAQVDQAP